MFGKQKEVEEKADLEVEIPQETMKKKKTVKKLPTKEEQIEEILEEAIEEETEETPEVTPTKKTVVKRQYQVVSGELIPEGMFRYVILTNDRIGDIGKIYDY